jgi:hypothetical protein
MHRRTHCPDGRNPASSHSCFEREGGLDAESYFRKVELGGFLGWISSVGGALGAL